MGATDRARGDQGVNFFLGKTQWGAFPMADIASLTNHGPLVQSVAGEIGRAGLGEFEKLQNPLQTVASLVGEPGGVDAHHAILTAIVFWGEPVQGIIFQHHSDSRMPAFQASE